MKKNKNKNKKVNRILIEEIDESRLDRVAGAAGPNDSSGQHPNSCCTVCGPDIEY